PRAELQARLLAANPDWLGAAQGAVRPDGDAELPADLVASFEVVGCRACGGALKPDVVFFGGTVAEPTLSAAWTLLGDGAALLVVGSSLTVYSGFRFVRRAHELAMPIAIVNVGPTRGDSLAQVRVSAPVGEVLPRLAAVLDSDPG
ncbi:MAG: Sir2 family NAD-dependent protein deacetylase, partial [Pseudomonadota bacterium]